MEVKAITNHSPSDLMADNQEQYKYALFIVKNLRVVRFHTKDELVDALRTLNADDKQVVVVKYHHGLGEFVLQEQWT